MIRNCYTSTVTLLADGSLCAWYELDRGEPVDTIEPVRYEVGPFESLITAVGSILPVIIGITIDQKYLLCDDVDPTKFRDVTKEAMSGSVIVPFKGTYSSFDIEPQMCSKDKVLIENGCVYVREDTDGVASSTKIEFERDEYVVDAISNHSIRDVIFLVTRSGACYYVNTAVHSRKQFESGFVWHFATWPQKLQTSPDCALKTPNQPTDPAISKFKPVCLECLRDYMVENMFVLNDFIVIQHDGGKLCMVFHSDGRSPLGQALYESVLRINPAYVDCTEKPIALPYFDDKDIVTASQAMGYPYFISSTGKVYVLRDNDITNPEHIPFFDDNPIDIPYKILQTKSAMSNLNDE